jgi:hypothetical protein
MAGMLAGAIAQKAWKFQRLPPKWVSMWTVSPEGIPTIWEVRADVYSLQVVGVWLGGYSPPIGLRKTKGYRRGQKPGNIVFLSGLYLPVRAPPTWGAKDRIEHHSL